MDERPKDPDINALEAISNSPPRRKSHSYSQQLRTKTGGHQKHHQHHPRNHSLDEIEIYSSQPRKPGCHDGGVISPDEEEFYRYSTTTGSIGGAAEMMDYVGMGDDDNFDESQLLPNHPLPEFIGSGGGVGVFKAPIRAAVHPNRPPCLEIRPHPLRETQGGKFIKTIGSTDTQLWAAQESGVRVWKYSDAIEPPGSGTGAGRRVHRGDEESAPFHESASTSQTLCLVVDEGSKLVWSGHKDGKIRSWKMEQQFSDGNAFKEGFSWQAHRNPVLSMTVSFYGDIWTGSEGGAIRIWPWESVEKSLGLSSEEKRMAALLVERSVIDLRTQVTVNGVCNISSSDVKYMLSDNVRAKVWAAGSQSFSLWNARTRELLKVFNIEGQIENRVEIPSSQEAAAEDDVNVKFVSKAKKEKPQGFLQRSRNALIGAADAVRRVAKGAGALVEDTKKIEAMVIAADGIIWTACSNGLLIHWDGNGNRLQDFTRHPANIQSICAHGSRIWVGYATGNIQVLDLEGNIITGWIAHNEPVIKLVVGHGFLVSLATHGGIRAWNISSPAAIDSVLRQELSERADMYTRKEKVSILIGSWNVGQGRATQTALMSWLGSAVSDIDIVVVGLQEVEMGAGFLAMSAARETVGLEGSSVGQWWQDHIGKALDEKFFERVGSRQLAALLIAIWVRKTLRPHVGDLDVAAVACGLGRAIGNKGGVGLRLRVYDRIICFVNCHFAAHLEAVNKRNADFDHIYRTMTFTRSTNFFSNAAAGVSSANQMLRGSNATSNPEEPRPDLAEADMIVFNGDFNYRLFGITYDEARDLVSQRSFDWLREKDQLRAEMKSGKVFQGMREALIRFNPTYKFEKGKPGLGGYDSGEKKRIPAWCDRVLYRDNRASPTKECSLECPVIASISQYEACMDVIESDHKPVRCKLNLDIAHVDKAVRRQEFGKILQNNEAIRASIDALRFVPETTVNTNSIELQNQDTFDLKITNRSGEEYVFYRIACEGICTVKDDVATPDYRLRGCLGFPRWLEVMPAAGMIRPDQVVDVLVHHEEFHKLEDLVEGVPQTWWSEDTRDKELILMVMVRGSCSTDVKTHRITVRHCFNGNSLRIDQRPDPSKRQEPNVQHKSF